MVEGEQGLLAIFAADTGKVVRGIPMRDKPLVYLHGLGGGGKWLLILLLIGGAVAAIGIAYWLFGSKPEAEGVPADYLAEPAIEPEPQGFADKLRHRIRHAVRSGKQASHEAQLEQERRYEELTQP